MDGFLKLNIMNIFYKVVEVWCEYPFQSEIDYRYCLFSFSRKKFKEISNLKMDSNTSIKEKEDFLKKELDIEKVNVIKL